MKNGNARGWWVPGMSGSASGVVGKTWPRPGPDHCPIQGAGQPDRHQGHLQATDNPMQERGSVSIQGQDRSEDPLVSTE